MRLFDFTDDPPADPRPSSNARPTQASNSAHNFNPPPQDSQDTPAILFAEYPSYVKQDALGAYYLTQSKPCSREFLSRMHNCLQQWRRDQRNRNDTEDIARLQHYVQTVQCLIDR
jgi:hypothetical protein